MKKLTALLFTAILLVSLMAPALAGRDPATCPHAHCTWKDSPNSASVQWWICTDCGKALYYRNKPTHNMDYARTPVKLTHGHDNCGHDHH